MDLTDLNKVSNSNSEFQKAIPVRQLVLKREYIITSFRIANTSYGKKVIAYLDDLENGMHGHIFLPSSTSTYLQDNEKYFHELQDAANKLRLLVIPQGGSKLEFKII